MYETDETIHSTRHETQSIRSNLAVIQGGKDPFLKTSRNKGSRRHPLGLGLVRLGMSNVGGKDGNGVVRMRSKGSGRLVRAPRPIAPTATPAQFPQSSRPLLHRRSHRPPRHAPVPAGLGRLPRFLPVVLGERLPITSFFRHPQFSVGIFRRGGGAGVRGVNSG